MSIKRGKGGEKNKVEVLSLTPILKRANHSLKKQISPTLFALSLFSKEQQERIALASHKSERAKEQRVKEQKSKERKSKFPTLSSTDEARS